MTFQRAVCFSVLEQSTMFCAKQSIHFKKSLDKFMEVTPTRTTKQKVPPAGSSSVSELKMVFMTRAQRLPHTFALFLHYSLRIHSWATGRAWALATGTSDVT